MQAYGNAIFGLVAAVGSLVASGVDASETEIENQLDTINKHFEAASKDFGGGFVQLHARKEGSGETEHQIYHFDCANKKYELLFSNPNEPESMPALEKDTLLNPIDPFHAVAPLAQHTCTKHGYPLLEW
ncbi:MAG: hypothetical protein AAF408_02035 [Pseudomonadota bacterium]